MRHRPLPLMPADDGQPYNSRNACNATHSTKALQTPARLAALDRPLTDRIRHFPCQLPEQTAN